MARKQEEQLHDQINSVIGFIRSNLRAVQLDIMLGMLKSGELTAEQSDAVKIYGDKVVEKFRAIMPMMKPDNE